MAIHQLKFSDEDYKKAAEKWRTELLLLPLMACQDTLKYMTGQPGIRGKEHFGAASSSAQFAPYKADRKSAGTTNIDFRTLETFFGNVSEDFEPNQIITTLLGQSAGFLGDSQKNAPSAKLVLACVAKSLGAHLNEVIFSAKRNSTGDTSADLFDGFGTIADAEITGGNISVEKKNLVKINEAVTKSNAVDIAKEIVYSQDKYLRNQDTFLFCDQNFADMYNEGYLLSHAAVPYNQKFEQAYIEGSNHKVTLAPLACLEGTNKFFVAPKSNMLYGYDNMGDIEKIQVDRFSPWILTFSAAMFFGTQFYSVDPRMLLVADMKVG